MVQLRKFQLFGSAGKDVMKSLTSRLKSALTVGVVVAAIASAAPVQAAVSAQGKTYTVTATMKGAKNLTVLMVSGSGRLLASAKVTKTSQKITLKAKGTSSIGGTTLQLVSGSGSVAKGKYYGPVVLGNKSATAAKSSVVYTKLKQRAATSVKLGTVTVKKAAGSTQQGYATTSTKSSAADTSSSASVKASKGRPIGVGTYGKTANTSIKSYGVSATAVGDPCSPPNTSTCDANGREIAPPGPQGPANPQQPGQQPGQPAANTTVSKDDTLGGDKDDDGIPNAFDVNDDGDTVLDSADATTPAPKVAVDDGTKDCSAVDFRIFTNYKATQGGFAGTINAYGPGAFKATKENIASTITKSMSMVFSPITQVCGSNVVTTELKGNGVAYAPSEYVALGNKCGTGDFQWLIGQGRICGSGGDGYNFGSQFTFDATNLPTGQDTFTMRVTTADAKSYEFTSSVGFVFVTHPMFVEYSTDGTNFTKVDYNNSTTGPEGARITEPTISVGQAQTLYLKVLRPQRLAMDGEAGEFYDLAGFKYTPDIPNVSGVGKCDQLTVTDKDMASDTVLDAGKPTTVLLTWAIGEKCFTPKNVAWAPGASDFDVQVEPSGPGGNSAQKIRITLS
jgi:hypothetical protein